MYEKVCQMLRKVNKSWWGIRKNGKTWERMKKFAKAEKVKKSMLDVEKGLIKFKKGLIKYNKGLIKYANWLLNGDKVCQILRKWVWENVLNVVKVWVC